MRGTFDLCPTSRQTPQATVDEQGWCTEHGWDCDDFALHLDDQNDRAQEAST